MVKVEIQALVEILSEKKIKILRFDKGEYASNDFKTFCRGRDKEGAHYSLQSSIKWCGKKKEPIH
jgi:hypothetical protein